MPVSRNFYRSGMVYIMLLFFMFSVFMPLHAQQSGSYNLTGIIVDTNSEPLPGVNLVVKGTTKGAITDVNGLFTINVFPDDTLIVSYVGYATQNIPVGGQRVLNVILYEDFTELEEVVVIGYGSVKRANLVGAVESIAADEVEDIPATNLSTILEGRMAGVHIGQATGRPGASTSLSIRIENTYSGVAEPLYVIDGFIRDKPTFDLLDPTEIESISVLKDASAAVYGVRGAYGVVLVTTKMGKEGKTRVNYSGSYGLSDVTQLTEMLSAYDHALMINDRLRITNPDQNSTEWYTDDELEAFKDLDYNWLERVWKPSSLSRHTLNVSGGSERVKYFVGGSYYIETGNFENLDVNKYSLRLGFDVEILKGMTARFSASNNNKGIQVPFYKGDDSSEPMEDMFAQLLQAPRWLPPYINGLPVGQVDDSGWWNPEALINTDSYKRSNTRGMDLGVNLTYKFPFVKGLTAQLSLNRGENHNYGKQYIIPYTLYNFMTTGGHGHIVTDQLNADNPTFYVNNTNRIFEDYTYGNLYQMNASLSYNRDFGLHHFDGMVVYEQSESSGYQFRAMRENIQIEGMELQKAFDPDASTTYGWMNESGRLSSVGRFNYYYNEKYILEATFRYEASVKFSPDVRWGLFPAVAVGWVISKEDFFSNNINFIDYLKIRASAGHMGNDYLSNWEWKYSFGVAGEYLFGNKLVSGIEAQNNGLVSTGVSWEKTNSYNAGMDIRLLDNRISLSVDGFYKYTYDILAARNSEMPTTTGITKMPEENYGEMKAWGYDMSIGYNDRIGEDFRWYIKTNFEFATNRVLKKPQSAGVIGTWLDEIGRPGNGYESGYVVDGIISTQEQLDAILAENPGFTIFGDTAQLGMLNFQDIGRPGNTGAGELPYVFEPDGKVDDYDQMHIVVPNMHLNWKNFLPSSFTLGGSWKGVKLDANFSAQWGLHKDMVDKNARSAPTATANVPSFWKDYWTPENAVALYPSPAWADDNRKSSTFWIRNRKELRLKVLTVSYTLPKSFNNRFNLPDIRVFFTGTNLWTPISTFDYKEDAISKYNSYPLMKTYNFGLSVSF